MEWILNIENGEYLRSILPRPGVTYQEKRCVLLIVVISKNHVTTVSHCCACVDHAYKNSVECGKDKEVPIQNEELCQTTPSEFKTDTECQTDFPKYTDPRGN